jgi:ariadne-1
MSSDSDNDYYYDDEDMMDEDDAYSDSVSEMDMDNEDFKIPAKEKKKSYEVDYTSLSQDAVVKLMNAELEHISGIFGVERDVAALLLRHLSWNKERLIEKYMDHANAVSVSAGVSLPDPDPASSPSSSSTTTARRSTRSSVKGKAVATTTTTTTTSTGARRTGKKAESPPAETFVCQICFDDDPALTTRSLDCSHTFCSPCWVAYISSKIRDEQEHSIRCMAEHCTLVAPDSFIRSILLRDSDSHTASQNTNRKRQDLAGAVWGNSDGTGRDLAVDDLGLPLSGLLCLVYFLFDGSASVSTAVKSAQECDIFGCVIACVRIQRLGLRTQH